MILLSSQNLIQNTRKSLNNRPDNAGTYLAIFVDFCTVAAFFIVVIAVFLFCKCSCLASIDLEYHEGKKTQVLQSSLEDHLTEAYPNFGSMKRLFIPLPNPPDGIVPYLPQEAKCSTQNRGWNPLDQKSRVLTIVIIFVIHRKLFCWFLRACK